MSYIRFAWDMKHVEGKSNSYVIMSIDPKTKKEIIIDYGHDKAGLVDMLFEWWETEDKLFKNWLLKELAKELGVKLRKKPLTLMQMYRGMEKETKKLKKKLKKYGLEDKRKMVSRT